jgi:succinate-semialdehyde dehydrogenase / glutarate-semialdehyde dehydrogenase
MPLRSINPATNTLLKEYPEMPAAEWRGLLKKADAAFESWRRTSFKERSEKMHRAGQILRERQDAHAELMAREMGKPLAQGRAEIQKCADACDFYAENAQTFLRDEIIPTDAAKSYVAFRPLGLILAIMPWNFPFWQVIRFAAPALMAGNGGILKHANNVTGCALALEDVFRSAGFPADLFRTVIVDVPPVAEIIAHPVIKAVTLTGSTRAGRAVASQAGHEIKKTVLELGGSDAYIVLEDADLDLAASTCASSRLINGGQSCIAAKRFIVIESVRKVFEQKFVEQMKKHKLGDPFEAGVEIGPLARHDLRDGLHRQVTESIAKGATLLLGGTPLPGAGSYYPATVLTNVKPGMPAYDEELFGPVASIIPAKDEADAVRIANDSIYGLGAAIFTRDSARGERLAANLVDAGSVFVNAFVRSDSRLPFGGIKGSGYGRELSAFGIREFVNIKTIYIGQGSKGTAASE